MKIAVTVARILLGLIFLIFGLNGFLHFIPMPPATGLAQQYFVVMSESHYMAVPFLIQVIGGALLLANRFVPLALTLLAPILVNILLFHATMAPSGLPLGLIATLLWFVVFYWVRGAFAGIFAPQTAA